jgi:hypothetical protein
MLPVDDVVGDAHVTGVKIDVEGMQMPVLRGHVQNHPPLCARAVAGAETCER